MDQQQLKRVLHYDPETGVFTWIVKRKGTRSGHRAGNVHGTDTLYYVRIKIDYHEYLAHRLAWLYMTGRWPKLIDHVNGDGTDNRFENLRETTHAINSQNQPIRFRSGQKYLPGVCKWTERLFGYSIQTAGERRKYGSFETEEEAHAAYRKAKIEQHKSPRVEAR